MSTLDVEVVNQLLFKDEMDGMEWIDFNERRLETELMSFINAQDEVKLQKRCLTTEMFNRIYWDFVL